MELNQTPVRTSKNYGINSINIKDINLNDKELSSQKFQNFKINNCENEIIEYKSNKAFDNYLSDELKNEIIDKSNFELNLTINNNSLEPKYLLFDLSNEKLIDVININLSENISSKLIIKFISNNYSTYHNGMIKINLSNNSKLDVIIVNDIGYLSSTFVLIESNLKKNTSLNVNIVDFSSKNSIFNYKSKIIGENSISNINSIYIGDNNSIIDLNYLIEILAPNSKTNMEVIGALLQNSIKHFKGTIDFKKGCKKSVGNENEFCMLLSKNAKSKALPMLLCTEEDVDGKHSSSVGKVDEKSLFYIMSRGLPYSEAVKLIVKAKFSNILNNIFDEKLKEEILNKIDGKIV